MRRWYCVAAYDCPIAVFLHDRICLGTVLTGSETSKPRLRFADDIVENGLLALARVKKRGSSVS